MNELYVYRYSGIYPQINEKSKVLEYTSKLAEKYGCPQYELFPDLSRTYSGFVF